MLLFVWKVVSGRTADHTFFLVFPVLLRLADVGLVAELGHLLSLGEELFAVAVYPQFYGRCPFGHCADDVAFHLPLPRHCDEGEYNSNDGFLVHCSNNI